MKKWGEKKDYFGKGTIFRIKRSCGKNVCNRGELVISVTIPPVITEKRNEKILH